MPYFKTENSNAENIKYDNTKSVKEAIDEIKNNKAASSVTFNNTDTSLASANVQDAMTEVNGNLTSIITKSGSTTLTANAATPLVCATNIENGTYLVIFMYAFEPNTQGQITLIDTLSSGYTTNGIDNYVQVCNFVQVTDNKVTVTLYSTSNQSSRNWRTKLIKLG